MSERENAIVYCEGAFLTTNGKTAHGLARRSERYRVLSIIDSCCAGRQADELLGGALPGIPIVDSVDGALEAAWAAKREATHFIIGLAPDGGRLPGVARGAVVEALEEGLRVISGLHDFLGDDEELVRLARSHKATITDVRRPPHRKDLHFFTGEIERVGALRVAVLGTDSAVGKRTTAWMLVDALEAAGLRSELIGTGQTAWLQGARYGVILDSLVNDFVSGEIEHAIVKAWRAVEPDVLVLEGQGSLLNPAYPGGFELLAAGRPQAVVLQHAPARKDYDGFPGYPIHPLSQQIEAVELSSGKPVIAVSVNAEGLDDEGVARACEAITAETGRPAFEPIRQGVGALIEALKPWLRRPEGPL